MKLGTKSCTRELRFVQVPISIQLVQLKRRRSAFNVLRTMAQKNGENYRRMYSPVSFFCLRRRHGKACRNATRCNGDRREDRTSAKSCKGSSCWTHFFSTSRRQWRICQRTFLCLTPPKNELPDIADPPSYFRRVPEPARRENARDEVSYSSTTELTRARFLFLPFQTGPLKSSPYALPRQHLMWVQKVWIGTFHAFGLDLVRRFHDR